MAKCHGVSCLLISSLLFFASMAAAEPIVVGVIVPLTGAYASLGKDCRNGVEAAERAFGESEKEVIKFAVADGQADQKLSIAEFRKLVQRDGARAVILTRSSIGMALNPISRQLKIPILGLVGHPDFVPQNEYAVQYWPSSDYEGGAIAHYAIEQGQLSAGIVSAEDEWTLSLSRGFRRAFEKGGTIHFDETVPPTEMDLASTVSKLHLKKPEAVYIPLSITQLAPFLKRARDQGSPTQFYSSFWVGKEEVVAAAGAAIDGVMYADVYSEFPKFRALQSPGTEITSITFGCFAAAIGAGTAARGGPSGFSERLRSQTVVTLPDEPLRFINRSAQLKIAMKRIVAGKSIVQSVIEP